MTHGCFLIMNYLLVLPHDELSALVLVLVYWFLASTLISCYR